MMRCSELSRFPCDTCDTFPSDGSSSDRPPARRLFARLAVILALILAGSVLPVAGEEAPGPEEAPPATPSRQACDSPEHRRFDFWVGTWDVVNRLVPEQDLSGRRATNRITLEEGGCVVAERYVTTGGYTGRSHSFYDAARGVWHQTWIDNRGRALYLDGRFEEGDDGGALVLSGEKVDGTLDRVTWRPLGDGRVQQLWEISEDGGESWRAVFDGLYTPMGE